jgi:cobalt/nickel transport system permease protein
MPGLSPRSLLATLATAAVVMGGALSWFSSSQPDGLEWSIARASGDTELAAPDKGVHRFLAQVQEHLSFLPDYGFPAARASEPHGDAAWPAVDAGTSLAGLIGGAATLAVVCGLALLLKRRRHRTGAG